MINSKLQHSTSADDIFLIDSSLCFQGVIFISKEKKKRKTRTRTYCTVLYRQLHGPYSFRQTIGREIKNSNHGENGACHVLFLFLLLLLFLSLSSSSSSAVSPTTTT
jgi:hypothetical protein